MEMVVEVKKTADGSCTLHLPELQENYHSINGAVQESMHIFINAGLFATDKENLKILEIGFGTGLNALLSKLNGNERIISYYAVEPNPLTWELINKLNYCNFLNLPENETEDFRRFHDLSWDSELKISSVFTLYKIKESILKFKQGIYDLVYFDAFAPAVQPELWTEELFVRLFNMMSENAILVTYCAKGEVRRSFQRAGFKVERLAGPPGKREILRAVKPKQ